MVNKLITKEKVIEFVSASVILSVLHWLVVSVFLKVLPTTFSEFFLSITYLMFIGAMTISFFVLDFLINNLKLKRTTLVRGAKYYIGFAIAVMIVLNEPLSFTFLIVTILKVFITINILERMR